MNIGLHCVVFEGLYCIRIYAQEGLRYDDDGVEGSGGPRPSGHAEGKRTRPAPTNAATLLLYSRAQGRLKEKGHPGGDS